MSFLSDAIERHSASDVEAALTAGADPNAAGESGFRPLGAAIEELQLADACGIAEIVAIVRALIGHQADVDLPYVGDKLRPVHAALYAPHSEILRILLAAGANAIATDEADRSPLQYAVANGLGDAVELLLQHGADRTIDSTGGHNGHTALIEAVIRLDVALVERLLAAGANAQATDSDGNVPTWHLPARTDANAERWDPIRDRLKAGSGATPRRGRASPAGVSPGPRRQ